MSVQARFWKSGLTVVANQYHSSDHFPADYPPSVARGLTGGHGQEGSAEKKQNGQSEGKTEVWSRGGSCIVGPLGEVLAGPLWDEEGIIYADVSWWITAREARTDVCGCRSTSSRSWAQGWTSTQLGITPERMCCSASLISSGRLW